MQYPSGRIMPLREQAIAAERKRRLQHAVLWARHRDWFALPHMLRALRFSNHFPESPECSAWLADGIFESNGQTTKARMYRLVRMPVERWVTP